jgi:hypothetical protein
MFSDIEGSTAMADRLGDTKFAEVLREHNAIIRDQAKPTPASAQSEAMGSWWRSSRPKAGARRNSEGVGSEE